MNARRRWAVLALATIFLWVPPSGAWAQREFLSHSQSSAEDVKPAPGIYSHADGDTVTVAGTSEAATPSEDAQTAVAAGVEYSFLRIPQFYCGTLDSSGTTAPCVDDAPDGRVVRTCVDGTQSLDPLFRRPVDGVGMLVGLWERVDDGGCPEDAPASSVVLTVEEFRRLPLVASTPQFQPAHGRGLVNMDLIAFTDAVPQTLGTAVLGVPVTVRATPVEYAWDFGDGSAPIVTADPGAPYPDYTIGHPYTRPGTYAVQLITTWSGEYQVAGAGPWLPVDGTATTPSDPFATEVVEARAHLVAEP